MAETIADTISWEYAQVDIVCDTTAGPYAARVLEKPEGVDCPRILAVGYGQSVGEALSNLGLLLGSAGVEDRRVQHLGAERVETAGVQHG